MDRSLSKIQELVMDRKPGVLQSMGSHKVGLDWGTELNWIALAMEFAYSVLIAQNLMHLMSKNSFVRVLWKRKVELICGSMLSLTGLFVTPWKVAHQAPPSMGFSRPEHWSGCHFFLPGDLPNPGMELMPPVSTWQTDSLSLSHSGSLNWFTRICYLQILVDI